MVRDHNVHYKIYREYIKPLRCRDMRYDASPYYFYMTAFTHLY